MKSTHLITLFFSLFLSGAFNMLLAHSAVGLQKDPQDVNYIDNKGRKQGQWIYYDRDIPSKNYPENGKIKEGNYEDNRKEGLWTMYYIDGETPKTKGNYSNNRPAGSFTKYWPNGKIKETGVLVKNKYQENLKRYNENGTLIYEANYNEDGYKNGIVKYYHDNAQLELVYSSKNGTLTGKAERYWPNGDIKEIIEYNSEGTVVSAEKHKMVSPKVIVKSTTTNVKQTPKPSSTIGFKTNSYNKLFNANKEIWMEGEFKNGILWNGRLYIYDNDGLLEKVEVYKNGFYHSDGQL